ncbi:MAG: outer membrane protein transport protein [Oleiphilaceae bacterium]|nr:outer membrane protein transport protein [Oleiphilaceae bacterium]
MRPLYGFRMAIAAAGMVGLMSTPTHGSSFQILEQSTARLGTAFSGTASLADDATTVFFNPAGMTQLDRPQLSLAGNLILVESEFNDEGSVAAAGTPLQQPLRGKEDETDELGSVPNFYYVHPFSERWRFGLGINAPFGLKTEYDSDWIGRYHATESELVVLNINPAVAFAVNDRLSLGLGLSYRHIDTTLKNQVDSFSACFAGAGAIPGAGATCAQAHGGPGNRDSDSSVKIEGDDDDVVADLSAHWRVTDNTRVGLIWRQGGDYTLDGSADFRPSASCVEDPFCSGTLQALDGDVEADVELPDTVTLSVSHRFDAAWQVHGDIAWTEWSSIKEIAVVNTGNSQTVSSLDLQYDDTLRYAVGASFEPGNRWTWRFGLAYDEAPQTDREFVTPRIPDQDRFWTSVGFNYAFSEAASVDVGYAHLFVDTNEIDKTDQGNRLVGDFDSSADILGAQVNWRF